MSNVDQLCDTRFGPGRLDSQHKWSSSSIKEGDVSWGMNVSVCHSCWSLLTTSLSNSLNSRSKALVA